MDRMRYVAVALVAGTVGAMVALLLAPHSGRDTRRIIRRRYEDEKRLLEKQGRRLVEDAGDYVHDRLEHGRRAAHEVQERVSDSLDEGRKRLSRIAKS